MIKKVCDGIYIGNWKDCQDLQKRKYRSRDKTLPMPTIHLDDVCGYTGTDERNRYYTITDLATTANEARLILRILDDCEPFIDYHRREGVLFHCAAGVSRSPTLAFLYLCRKEEITKYWDFKALYPEWFPNLGFEALFRELGID